jgi:UDPglucose 6-dehydrogenase
LLRKPEEETIFSTDVEKAIDEAQIIFISVNTPTKTYGKGKGMAADLKYIELCARQIAKYQDDKIVVENQPTSTNCRGHQKHFDNTGNGVQFQILSIQNFLAEGTAVGFVKPRSNINRWRYY